jgi:hypothetical protein
MRVQTGRKDEATWRPQIRHPTLTCGDDRGSGDPATPSRSCWRPQLSFSPNAATTPQRSTPSLSRPGYRSARSTSTSPARTGSYSGYSTSISTTRKPWSPLGSVTCPPVASSSCARPSPPGCPRSSTHPDNHDQSPQPATLCGRAPIPALRGTFAARPRSVSVQARAAHRRGRRPRRTQPGRCCGGSCGPSPIRIRRRIAARGFRVESPHGQLTVSGLTASIGGAHHPGQGADLTALLWAADAALCDAERAGRNRCSL